MLMTYFMLEASEILIQEDFYFILELYAKRMGHELIKAIFEGILIVFVQQGSQLVL